MKIMITMYLYIYIYEPQSVKTSLNDEVIKFELIVHT